MANTYETASVVLPSGLEINVQRILTSGGAEEDKAEGWIHLGLEAEGRTYAVGFAGPPVIY